MNHHCHYSKTVNQIVMRTHLYDANVAKNNICMAKYTIFGPANY